MAAARGRSKIVGFERKRHSSSAPRPLRGVALNGPTQKRKGRRDGHDTGNCKFSHRIPLGCQRSGYFPAGVIPGRSLLIDHAVLSLWRYPYDPRSRRRHLRRARADVIRHTLPAYIAAGWNYTSNDSPTLSLPGTQVATGGGTASAAQAGAGNSNAYLLRAFIQLGGFTFGKTASFYDFFNTSKYTYQITLFIRIMPASA